MILSKDMENVQLDMYVHMFDKAETHADLFWVLIYLKIVVFMKFWVQKSSVVDRLFFFTTPCIHTYACTYA